MTISALSPTITRNSRSSTEPDLCLPSAISQSRRVRTSLPNKTGEQIESNQWNEVRTFVRNDL